MPVISFRLDKAELTAIRKECSARGFLYVSELVREKLGLPPGQGKTAPSPAMERIGGEVHDPAVARELIEVHDRLDQILRVDHAIAKQVGVPKETAPTMHHGEAWQFATKPDPVGEAGFER